MTEKRPEDATDNHPQAPAGATHVAPISANTGDDLMGKIELSLLTCGISISYFLVLLNSTVVVTTIPSITTAFDSDTDVGWYGSAYLLSSCVVQPLAGKIYTFLKLKFTFLFFLALFELGSLLCGVAQSSEFFIVGRAIAGAGAAGITSGAMTIVAASAPRRKRPYIVGFVMAIGSMGQVTGPLVGGALAQHVSWRWSFYINLPVGGLTALLLVFLRIPEQRAKAQASLSREQIAQLDLIGFSIVAPSIVMFLLALNWGGETYAWASAKIIGLLCGACVALCIFLIWEWRMGEQAMVPLYMFRRRIIVSCLATGFLQSGAIVEMTYFLPIWFQVVRGDSPTTSGVNIMPTVGAQIFFAATTGLLVAKLGYPLPFAQFGSSCLAIGAGLMSTLLPSTSTGKWAGFQILTGAGRGIVQQLPIVIVQAVLTGDEIAIGSSLLAFTQYLGGAVFISSANSLFSNKLVSSLGSLVPASNSTDITHIGATELASSVPAQNRAESLLMINDAITGTFYLAAAAGTASVLTSLGVGLVNVKKAKATSSD